MSVPFLPCGKTERKVRMKKVCRGIAFAICGILAVLTILLVLPGLFGIHPLIVKSGSMEPVYPMGSLLYVQRVEEDELREGRPVTFYLPDEETLVTHRIVDTDADRGVVYTKGDANEVEDGVATPFSRVVGCPFLCIPHLGYLAGYLSSPLGKAGIMMLVIAVCILSWIDGSIQRGEEDYEREQA